MTEAERAVPQPSSAAYDFTGMFSFLADPAGAARRLPRPYFWIAPLILVSIVLWAVSFYNFPYIQQVTLNQPPPPNVDPAKFQNGLQTAVAFQRIAIYCMPLFVVVFSLLSALVVYATGAATGLKTKFLELFNLMLGLSLIGVVEQLATTLILHAKGEPTSAADLRPALGLNIFLSDANKYLDAILGFFNPFEIWQIVMAVLILAIAYRVNKLRAFYTVAPLYLLALMFRLIGAAFSQQSH